MKRKIFDKGNIFVSYTLFLLVVTTTIIYSSLSTKLALISDAMFRVPADIRVTGIKLESASNGAVENYSPKYDVSETTTGFTLPNADSSITYRVTITNYGYRDQTVYDFITKSLNVSEDDVEITISDFIKAKDNSDFTIIDFKSKKDVLLTIKTKNPSNTQINLIEKYDFRKIYDISFDANGGTNAPKDIKKVERVDLKLPDDEPYLKGNKFLYWTENKDGTGAKYKKSESYTLDNDVILYAQWEKVLTLLDIDYNVDGNLYKDGYGNRIYVGLKINGNDIGYTNNYSSELPYETTYEIYGLKLDDFPISYSGSGTLTSDTNLVIPFYTINFSSNNTDYGTVNVDSYIVKPNTTFTVGENITLNDGRSVKYTVNTKKGYTTTFDKFTYLPENTTINSKTNVVANFSRNIDKYFITYDLNGGQVENSNPEFYTIESENITLTNPTKDGYIFEGWTGTNGTTPQTDITIYKGSTGDRKYTANYRRDSYLFEIAKDNGIKSFDVKIDEPDKDEIIYTEQTSYSEKLSYETEITISNIKLENGYIFDSYEASNKLTELSNNNNLSKVYKLGAGSSKVSLNSTENTYKVTYISSENGGSTDIQVEYVKYKSLVDLSKTSEKEGYKFVGWNKDKSSHKALEPFSMPYEDVILYSIYSKELTATFNVQNVYSATSSASSDSCTLYNNDKLCLVTSPSLTAKEGYTVYGWNTDKTSTSPSLGYVRETSIGSDVTYYSIASKPIGSLNIILSGDMHYTGKTVEPIVTIKDNDVTLTKDKDYSISYGKNISKTGTVTITSKNVYNESSKIFYTSNVAKTFTIEKIDDVITATAKTASYTGSKITANSDVETLSNSKLTFTYFDNTNCTGNQLEDAPINRGNYSVKIVSAGNDNYNSAETCVPHKITQGKPTVTLENKEANYSGSQIQIDAPAIKNPNGSIISIPYTVNYYNGSSCSGSTISTPINGGTYSAKVITNENNNLLSADSNCATLRINSIENPTVVTPVANIKYGDDKKMVVTTKLQGTIYYSVGTELTKDNYTSKGSTEIPTSKDLSKNDYNVYYYVKGNSNYKDAKGFVIVSVGVIQNTIEVSPVTGIKYGENKEMVTTKNAQGVVYYSVGTELTDDNYTSGKTSIPTSEGKNAGDYIIYYFTKGNTNYGKAAGKVTVNIAKINDTITLDPVETEYTGDAIFANDAITKSNTKVTYKYYNGENCISENEITGAPISYRDGGYSVKATSDGGNNYYPASICVKHTINKATNPVKVSAKNGLVYSAKSDLLSVSNELYSTMYYSIGTPLTDDNYLTAGSTDIPKTYIENGSEIVYRNAGSYKLYYYAKGDNNHKSSFNKDKDAIDVNIDKASSECTIVREPSFALPTHSGSFLEYSCTGDGDVNVTSKNIDSSDSEIVTIDNIDKTSKMVQLTANGVGKSLISVYTSEGNNYKASEKSNVTIDVKGVKFTIGLNDIDNASDSEKEKRNKNVYSVYKKGVYLDSETTEQMTITGNGIRVPEIAPYTLKKHLYDDVIKTQDIDYKFLGYYKDTKQLIDSDGLITNEFSNDKFTSDDKIDMKLKKDGNLTDPEKRTGYTFEGWYTSYDKTGAKVTDDNDFLNEGITDVYAHWLTSPKIKSSTTAWTNTSVSVSIEENGEGTSDSGEVSYQYYVSETEDIPEDAEWIDLTDDNVVTIDTDDETSKKVYVYYRSVSSVLYVNSNGEIVPITSDPSNYALVQIDKVKPDVTVRAYKISDDDPRVTVESGTWSNKYLEFRFNTPTTGKSGGIIYYCIEDAEINSDSEEEVDSCNPSEIVAANSIVPGTESKEGKYKLRYMVVSGSGNSSDIYEYDAMVDVTNPTLYVITTLLDSDTALDPMIINTNKMENIENIDNIVADYDNDKKWSVLGYSFDISGTNDKIDQSIDDDESNVGSGIASIEMNINADNLTSDYKDASTVIDMTDDTSVDVTDNGYRFGYITVTDNAGNKSVFVFDLKIDNVEPEIDIKAYNKSGGEIVSGALSATGLTYKITILKKGISGAVVYSCSTYASSYDPNNPCEPTTRLGSGTNDVVTSTGYANVTSMDKYIRVKATSGSNIDSEIQTHYGRVGTVDVNINVYREDNSTEIGSKTWVNSTVKFKLNAVKELTATLKYCVDTDESSTCTPNTVVAKNTLVSLSNGGKFYIRYNATKDNVVSKTYTFAAYVDRTAPAITVTGNPTSWTKSKVTLKITVRDSFSGLSSLTVNGKKVATKQDGNIYTASYVVSANGSFKIVATDTAKNQRTTTQAVTKIDTTAPKVKIKIYKSDANGNKGDAIKTIASDYSTGKWVNYFYYFDLSASTDSQSGISKVTMGYSAGGKKTISTTISGTRTLSASTLATTVRSNGARYLVFTVTDTAGNKAVVKVKIYIDVTAPTMSLKLYAANSEDKKVGAVKETITESQAVSGWKNYRHYFDLTGSADSLSGIASIKMQINKTGIEATGNTAEGTKSFEKTYDITSKKYIVVGGSGNRFMRFTITDKAGNKVTRDVRVYIDLSKPTITWTGTSSVYGYNLTAYYTCNDKYSKFSSGNSVSDSKTLSSSGTVTATCTDKAGNTTTSTRSYSRSCTGYEQVVDHYNYSCLGPYFGGDFSCPSGYTFDNYNCTTGSGNWCSKIISTVYRDGDCNSFYWQ